MKKTLKRVSAAVLTAGLIGTVGATAAQAASGPPPVAQGAPCYKTWKPHWYSDYEYRLVKDVKWSSCTYYNTLTFYNRTVYKFKSNL